MAPFHGTRFLPGIQARLVRRDLPGNQPAPRMGLIARDCQRARRLFEAGNRDGSREGFSVQDVPYRKEAGSASPGTHFG